MKVGPRGIIFPLGNMMLETSQQLGASIRRRRKALGLTQEELALTVDVGPRFIVELEAGKPTCQLGKALAVARAVGIRLADAADTPPQAPAQEFPQALPPAPPPSPQALPRASPPPPLLPAASPESTLGAAAPAPAKPR